MLTIQSFLSKQPNSWKKINRLSMLIFSFIVLYIFVAFVSPFMSDVLGFSDAHQAIIDENIDAGEWFYIFVDQMRDIEPRVQHTLQYTPGITGIEEIN